jgi:hypothetical protein
MAQIDKIYIQEEGLTYNIAQSPDATFSAISNDTDTASAKSWTEVDKLVSGETNGSIFNKMSKMFSNIRYLYNELGGSSGSGGSIVTRIEDLSKSKANQWHAHQIWENNNTLKVLPVVDQIENKSDSIPRSDVLYWLSQDYYALKKKVNEIAPNFNIATIP